MKQKSTFNLWYKTLCLLMVGMVGTFYSYGQIPVTVSGTAVTSPALAGSYTSLALALADLNAVTSYTTPGTIIFICTAGGTETAPPTGLVIGSATLNPLLSATNTVTITISGGTVTVNAGVGTSTPGSAAPDGIISMRGADFVTINGLTLTDGNIANPGTMEFGVGMFKLSVGDGCNNNTIQNCTINMQRINNASGTTPALDGAVGIEVYNSIATAATTSLTPTNGGTLATNGTNSGNKFYTNTINGGNIGIGFGGYAASGGGPSPTATTFLGDLGNDVGGTSAGTGNIILNFGGGAATSPAAGIRLNNQWSVNVQYNNINNNNGAGVNHATTLRGIYGQAGTSASATISNNTISLKSAATSSAMTGIDNSIGTTSASNTVNINNNTIQNCTYSTGTSATFNCISNSNSCTTLNINSNIIQNNTFTGATTSGTLQGILNSSANTTFNCNSNQIINNTIGTSGSLNSCTFYGVQSSGSPTNFTANSNTITGNTLANSYGTMYCLASTTSTISFDGNTIANNTIPNNSSSTSSGLYGFYNNASAATETYSNNNIYNLTINGNNTSTSNTIYGIFPNTASGLKNIAGNNINNLTYTSSSTGSATVVGIRSGYASTANIFKNIVHSLGSTGTAPTVYGIYFGVTTYTTANVFNNIVGNLTAPQRTGFNVVGIYCGNVGTTYNVVDNTVYLNAPSSASGSASSCIYQSGTTPTLVLGDNIMVNLSTGTTSWLSTAFRRTSTTLTSYSTLSNNNMVYCGTPSATNAIYYDGTNTDQTLAAWKARVTPRETNSVTETVSTTPGVWFQSFTGPTTGIVTTFLHMVNGLTTLVESGGAPAAGITDDIDGNTRNVSTPDIGADEFAGVVPPPMAYFSSTTTQTNTSTVPTNSTNNQVIGIEIVTTGSTSPISVSSFTFNTNGTTNVADITNAKLWSTGTSSTFATTSQYGLAVAVPSGSFNITGSLPLSTGTNYFWLTYDVPCGATLGNVIDAECNSLTVVSVYAPTIQAPSGSRTIVLGPLSGTYTVGSGGNYATLGAAATDINAKGLGGNVILSIISNTSETGAVTINQWAECGGSGFTLNINPAAATTPTISGSVSSGALIVLNGADRVTIDGSNSGGTDKSLTITNTSTTAPTVISLVSLGTGTGATNNTIKNCILNTGVATSIGYGISVGGSTPGTTGADNDNIILQNNAITIAPIGIYATGTASVSSGGDDNLNINGNSISYNSTLASLGIEVGNALNSSISQNTISEQTTSSQAPTCISLETGFVSSTVTRNNIINSSTTSTSGYGGRGITVGTGSATSNITIANNFISGVNGSNFSGFSNSSSMGIGIGMVGNSSTITTVAGGISIYYNSINMYGNHSYTSATNTAALYVGSAASGLDIRNNIFVNSLNNTTSAGSKDYCIYSAATISAFSSIDYNDYWTVSSTNSTGVLGFLGVDQNTLLAMQTAFGGNTNSKNIAPVFVSNSDLHLPGASNTLLNDLGTFIASVTIDYDGTIRSVSTPDMGADEFSVPTCTTAIGGTASGSTSFCGSGTPAITATGYSFGLNSTYQWYSSTNFGDYPNAGSPVGGQTNPASLSTGTVSTTTYYWLRVTCATNSSTDNSTLVTITINPSVANISGTSVKCANDPAVTLAENGGTGTSWSWSTGETTQSISVNPGSTTTYTVTVTSAGPCTATASKTLTINPNPSGVTATASATSVCSGSPFNLFSSANPPVGSSVIFSDNFNSTTAGTTTSGNLPSGWSGSSLTAGVRIWGVVASAQSGSTIGGGNFLYCESDLYTAFQTRAEVITPTFNAAGYTSVNIKFKQYYNDLTSGSATDSARVYVSNDGGANYILVQAYDADQGTAFSGAGAVQATLPVGISLTNNMKVKLVYNSDAGGNDWYWAVDDFSVEGIPPFAYSWSSTPSGFTSSNQNPTGVTQTTVTNYTVTVTGLGGCSSTANVNVGLNAPPVANCSGTNVLLCNGDATGSAAVSASGGTPGYTYLWSNTATTSSISGLTAGTYCVTITDALGCTATCCYTVIQPPVIVPNLTSVNVTCNGLNNGSASVNPTGGTGGYTYSWSNGTTGSANLGTNKDNTLYEQNQNNSNGAGEYMFSGELNNGLRSRSVLAFDLTSIPAGAVITGVTLTLHASQPGATGAQLMSLQNVTADWGEGTSNAGSPGGTGAAATPNDATWINRFHPATPWTSLGGDFNPSVSGSTIVNNPGFYAWNSTGMAADVQAWLANPSSNFGWILRGLENGTHEAKRFDTKENVNPAFRPSLAISYTIPVTTSSQSGLSPGTYTVTITDANGCTKTASATITQPAVLTVAAGSNSPVCQGSTINLSAIPTGGTPAYSYLWSNGSTQQNPSIANAQLADGTTYTVTVTDSHGCTASGSTTVVVNPPPVIGTCPNPIVTCNPVVTFATPSATGTPTPTVACSPASGSTFVVGTTTVTCTASNICGSSSCSFTVTVNEAPTISCPAPVTTCNPVVTFAPSVTGTPAPTVSCTPASGSTFAIGTTTVNCSASNICGTATCSFTVTVNEAPAITCPNPITTCNPVVTFAPTATGTPAPTVNCTPPSGSAFATGTTTVNCTATNSCGSASCSFTVTVNDPLTISCPAPIITCNPVVTFTPTTTGTPTPSVTCTPASGSSFAVGTTTVNCSASNTCGTATCSFTVTVNEAPTIQCPAPVTTCNPVVTFAPTTTGSPAPTVTCTPASGSTFPVGTTTVNCSASNSCGTATCSFTVTVNSTPVVTCPAPISVNTSGGCSQLVTYTTTATGLPTPTITCNPPSGSTFPVGTTTVNCTAGNTCGTSTCSFTVTVNDNEPPVIGACPGNIASCFGAVTFTAPGATDNCVGATVVCTPPSGSVFSVGVTTVNCVATDTHSNTSGCSFTVTIHPTPSVTISQNNVSFPGGSDGSATANPSGGTPAYSYAWSTGSTNANITNLTAGTYTVTVTDAFGCTATASAVIIEANNITITLTPTSVSCFGGSNGSITSGVTGGTPAFTYAWSNGMTTQNISGLAAATYTVTVTDANSVTKSGSVAVLQPGQLLATGTKVDIACRGASTGSISMAPTGGTPPFTYLWNNGATTSTRSSLVAGTYTVTVNDANNCGPVSASFTFTNPATNLLINSSKVNVRCPGNPTGEATASPSGGTAPYTYSWNTIPVKTIAHITQLYAGVYVCTVTDAIGCTKTLTVTITEPPAFNVVQTQSNVTFPGGNNGSASVSVSGGTPGYTYSWNTVPVKTTASITGLTAGVYKCTITDTKTCLVKVSFTITEPVARPGSNVSEANNQELVVFPNPTNGMISVKIDGLIGQENIDFFLVDLTGRVVYQNQIQWSQSDERLFDFSSLSKGVYYIHSKSQSNNMIQKIVIQ